MTAYLQGPKVIYEIENNANGDPIFIGEATPGTATSAARWRIKKVTYSGTSITKVQWANGESILFKEVYDDRASLSYS